MLRRVMLCGVVLISAMTGLARSEVVSFIVPIQADFEFRLEGGTFLNPGAATDYVPFRAVGDMTFTLDPFLNDPNQPTTVDFTNVTADLVGVPPSPPEYLPFVLTPNLEFIGGQLTNIVRDGSGEVISADVSNLLMRWAMKIGPDPNSPALTLYTLDGLPFDATGVTLPFALGTTLSGAAMFKGYVDGPNGTEWVASGQNRFLTVVPEPTSLAQLGLGALGMTALAGRRRRLRSV